MNELIVFNNGIAILDPETEQAIASFERQAQLIKKKQDALKVAILEEMQRKNIVKLETPELNITYVAATTRESFDSQNFRKSYPDLYDEFCRISPVKASVRLKLK